MEKNYYVLTISGNDRPGITSMLTEEISKAGHELVDIGQSVILGYLNLSALIDLHPDHEEEFFKSLLFQCKNKNLNFEYKKLPMNVVTNEVNSSVEHARYILTCVSLDKLHAPFITKLTKELSNNHYNIEKIQNSTYLNNYRVLEIGIASTKAVETQAIKERILELAAEYNTDVAVVDNDVFRFNKRLIVFDMDSTLIEQEVIDELARLNNKFEEVQKITHLAMNGKIDFKQSLEQRVSHLKGLSIDKIEHLKTQLTFTAGTKECLQKLKSLGFKTAIISGGFKPFTEYVKRQLEIDYDFGNSLDIQNGICTGKVHLPIIDAQEKANILSHLALREGIQLKQTVAVGDGSNDLIMLKTAGMGIAFHAKEIVQKKSQFQLNYGPMTSILPMLGLAT
jgi:phosphoserine phosphatase